MKHPVRVDFKDKVLLIVLKKKFLTSPLKVAPIETLHSISAARWKMDFDPCFESFDTPLQKILLAKITIKMHTYKFLYIILLFLINSTSEFNRVSNFTSSARINSYVFFGEFLNAGR